MKKILLWLFFVLLGSVLALGLTSQFNKTQAQTLPVYTINYQETPYIAYHVYQAIYSQNKPWKLTYTRNESLNDSNRYYACKYLPSPRPTGYECDEYPFASTYQGGEGASAVLVPAHENEVQGGNLSAFYRNNNLKDGDQFLVGISW